MLCRIFLCFRSCPLFLQALKCTLYGLDKLDVEKERQATIVNRLVELVEDKTLVAEVIFTHSCKVF